MKKIIYIILIIVFFLIGFGVGKISEKGRWQGELAKIQGEAKKEIDWYKSLLEPFYPPLPEEIKSVSGKITKIENKTIWMEASIRVSQFPLPEGKEIEKKNIKVNITDQTKISKIEMPEIPLPEKPFKETILKFEDLKVGDQITVTSAENIKGKTEILASQIQVTK
jgi:ABC-type cobalt transport system substrate-binding protein